MTALVYAFEQASPAAGSHCLICRHKERPQRSLQVWGFDVSKQIVSAGAAHICGIPLRSFHQFAWSIIAQTCRLKLASDGRDAFCAAQALS